MNDRVIVEAAKECDDCVVFTFEDFDKGRFVDVTLQDLIGIIERQCREIDRLNTLANLGNMRANDYRVMRNKALKAESENKTLREEILRLKEDVSFGQRTCREWSETCDELSKKLEGAVVGQETLQKRFTEEIDSANKRANMWHREAELNAAELIKKQTEIKRLKKLLAEEEEKEGDTE